MRQGQVFQCSLSRGLLSHGQILLIGRTSEIAGAFPPLVHRFPGQSHHSVLVALSTCPLRINVDKAVFLTQSVWLLTRYACSNPYDTSGMQSVLANVQSEDGVTFTGRKTRSHSANCCSFIAFPENGPARHGHVSAYARTVFQSLCVEVIGIISIPAFRSPREWRHRIVFTIPVC